MGGGGQPQFLYQGDQLVVVGQLARVGGRAAPLAVGRVHGAGNVLGGKGFGIADVDHAHAGLLQQGRQGLGGEQWLSGQRPAAGTQAQGEGNQLGRGHGMCAWRSRHPRK